jgi:methylmalonyl-CoA mutase
LLEESNIAKVADPAAGSGGIEDLTDKLCRVSWALFQEIEAAGGAPATLEKGLIQEKIAKVCTERVSAVAHRKDALVGTSDYPLLAEAPVEVFAIEPVALPPPVAAIRYPSLTPRRLAEPYEALRDASDRILSATGARPRIFLANLGTLAEFTPRAAFAKNFFEAGGIEAVMNDGFKDRNEMVAAFRASGAKLACLCSSDAVYEIQAVDAAKSLSQAGANHIYLAGRPKKQDAYRAAGIGTLIFAGCNVLATLTAAHDMIKKISDRKP